MNEQELNIKLAEWVGLKYDKQNNCWKDKNQSIVEINFTESLDACFKWLVPKVAMKSKNHIALFSFTTIEINNSCAYLVGVLTALNPQPCTNPALGLCLGIEKIIDKIVL